MHSLRTASMVAVLLGAGVRGPAAQDAAGPIAIQQQAADPGYREALQGGIEAYKAGNYEAAMQHFREAVLFNPTSTQARLYLGTVYAQQVVPGLDTPENLAIATNAIETLRGIPATAPEFLAGLRQIAAVQRDTKRLDDARRSELQVLDLAPRDAEAHYTLGVVDWQQAYKNAIRVLAAANLQDDGVGNTKLKRSACSELRTQNAALVDDGIRELAAAVELRPSYDDAMSYLNLTYRRQADFACGDETARQRAVAKADEWSARAADARKQNQVSKPTSEPTEPSVTPQR